ncbi:alpha/beta fold hydrolase [Nakamurella sp.]|uniref:alpha/beta fold hydrolase n=1 Tax=Nakamurella sp. TaxID=1869182 RepID=UPI003B3BCF80
MPGREDDQAVRFVRAGGHHVAYAVVGAGPPVVLGGWWCANLELNWQDPRFRQFLAPLAARHSIIRFDPPGTGASDGGDPPATVEEEVALLGAVVDALGVDRFSLIGASSGAAAAAAFAVRRPGRVERLVLYGSFARGAELATAAARDALLDVVSRHWGLGSRLLADLFVPGASDAERADFARFQRRSARPEQAVRSLAATYRTDVTGYLPRVRVSTHVIHRRGDRAVPCALGADVARRIRGAGFVPLDGVDHFPWRGDATSVADAMLRGLGHRSPTRPEPVAVTGREREILALVAQGLTDTQIAERLTLSPHTVHRHIANARTKLGVRSRAAAAAALGAVGG